MNKLEFYTVSFFLGIAALAFLGFLFWSGRVLIHEHKTAKARREKRKEMEAVEEAGARRLREIYNR